MSNGRSRQSGLAESSIKSLNLLVSLQMVESGMTGVFWFRALRTAKDARNATYHECIKTHMLAYRSLSTVNPRTFPSFGRLNAVHSRLSIRIGGVLESMQREHLKASISVLQQTAIQVRMLSTYQSPEKYSSPIK
jgi:hypothetical protein